MSPHYLIKINRHINSTFWSQSLQCVRSNWLFATYAEIWPMFFFSNSWKEILYQSSVRKKISHSHRFFMAHGVELWCFQYRVPASCLSDRQSPKCTMRAQRPLLTGLLPTFPLPGSSSLLASRNTGLFLPRTERRLGDRAFSVTALNVGYQHGWTHAIVDNNF